MRKEDHTMLKISVGLLGGIMTLMVTYFAWSSNTLLAVDKKVEVMSAQMVHYTNLLKVYIDNQYTQDEAEADKVLYNYKLEGIYSRLDKLEGDK